MEMQASESGAVDRKKKEIEIARRGNGKQQAATASAEKGSRISSLSSILN